MDSYTLDGLRNKPEGYYRVQGGTIRPDDLVWSCFEREFLPASDPGWRFPPTIDNSACVIRKARHEAAPGQQIRSYQLKRQPDAPTDVSGGFQTNLFA
jgi:hypothetical protein